MILARCHSILLHTRLLTPTPTSTSTGDLALQLDDGSLVAAFDLSAFVFTMTTTELTTWNSRHVAYVHGFSLLKHGAGAVKMATLMEGH